MSTATTGREVGLTFRDYEVRAILEGRKTQTRRAVKNPDYYGCLTGDCPHQTQAECNKAISDLCPYGKTGYVIWVRESFSMNCDKKGVGCVYYKADKSGRYALAENGGEGDWVELSNKSVPKNLNWSDCVEKWSPAMQMPRWAARLFLTVTDVRIERTQSINGPDSWSANPWVWVIEFEKVHS